VSHGRDCPDRCSMCLERAGLLSVSVRRVSQEGAEFVVGAERRPIDLESRMLRIRFASKKRRQA